MQSALLRFRVMAYVVGIMLLALVFVAMPLKYLADRPALVETIGPVHGFLYMAYLVFTFDLSRRVGWSLGRIALLLLAGTIPFASFFAERWATRMVRASSAVAA